MKLKKQYFIQTINSNRGKIRSLCKAYYHCHEDQRDAFQDIVLQLWKSFDSFIGESEIGTWIYRVSLNTILSKIKKEKKSVTTETMDTKHLGVSTIHADDHVELLSLIIKSLKDIDKAIVLLYLEGYRNKEIGEMLQLSQTNVNTRFNRVKSQLKLKFNHKSYAS